MDEHLAASPRAARGRTILLALLSSAALVLAARAAMLAFEPQLPPDRFDLLLLNLAPVLLIGGAVFALTGGRMLFTACWGYALLWALYLANSEKIEHMSRSLRPGDFSALPTFVSSPGLFLPYLETDAGSLWWAGIAVILAVALLWFEPRSLRLRWRWRSGLALLFVVAFVWLVRDPGWDTRLAGIYDRETFQLWEPEAGMQAHGLCAGLLKLGWATQVGRLRPDETSVRRFARDAAQWLAMRRERPPPPVRPDIVIVQSEALFDPADLRGIEADTSLPNFRRLAARGLSGRLRVPTYAGGTIRTEFELLTGYPLTAFPAVEYPYLGMALRTPSSIARALAPLGYERVLVHPYQREFWNREDALPALGFDTLMFDEQFVGAPTSGWFTQDAALYDHVLSILPVDADAPPQLILAVTMENHGPWSRSRGLPEATLAAQTVPEGLTHTAADQLRNYLALLASGDRALGVFADALLARERPVLLLVYGDHLPDLGAVYEALGFDDGEAAWRQTVPYFVLSNLGYPATRLDTDSAFLASLLLDAVQAPMDGYLAFNAIVRDELAVDARTPAEIDHLHALLRSAAQLDYTKGGLAPLLLAP